MSARFDAETEKYLEDRRGLTDLLVHALIGTLDLKLAPEEIGLDSPLFGSGLGLDSVDAVAIAATVEERFEVKVLDSDIQAFRSVNSIVDFILGKKGSLPLAEEAPGEPAVTEAGATAAGVAEEVRSLAEDYRAIRGNAVSIDYSDRAVFRVEGPDHEKFLDGVVAGNLADLAVNGMLQTVVLSEEGRIDAILWIARDDAGYLLMTGPGKRGELRRALEGALGGCDVTVKDVSAENGIISIVGPRAQDFMVDFLDEDILRLGYGEFMTYPWKESSLLVTRIGETGEFDYRIFFPAGLGADMARALEEAGSARGIRMCGKGVLDSLFLEMKSILQETVLREPFFPSELDLQWMVWTAKESFRGRDAVLQSMKEFQRLAIVMVGDAPVAEGEKVRLCGVTVGSVLAKGYSFQLSKFLALAAVERACSWPNLRFQIGEGNGKDFISRSAPLFLTKTVLESLSV